MYREARRSTRKRSNQVRDVEVENRFRHPEKFGLRLRVLIMKIAEASMQFLATLEPS